jgi:lipoprotein-anchoring transpeptidase ErfK/SrfK
MRRAARHLVANRAAAPLAVLVLAGVLAGPAAAAQSPATAVRASVRVALTDAFAVSRQSVTVPGRIVHVVGVVRPYVPGQLAFVRAFLNGRIIQAGHFRLKPSHSRAYGAFTATVRSQQPGVVTVVVIHAGTTGMKKFTAHQSYSVLGENIGFGSTGRFVQLIQQRLAALHFYIPQTGVYDSGTGLALDAYHRLLRWGTSQNLDGRTASALLSGSGRFPVHYSGDGRHAEGDLTLQLLALIDGSKVLTIYPISSGKPSTPTILGRFHVYSKVPGYLPDGMYFSNFFFGGYAIHGYNPAPDYPASHGCMRLPIVDAISVFNWLKMGNAVDVYY